MELENIVANTVYLKAREGKEMYGKVAMSAIVLRPLSSALTRSLLAVIGSCSLALNAHEKK